MTIASWMQSPLWLTAGWVMLHFLWVGTAVGLVAAAGRWLLANRPQRQYAFALACFAAVTCSPVVIFLCLHPERPSDSDPQGPMNVSLESGESPVVATPLPDEAAEAPPTTPRRWILNALVQYLPWLWLIGTPCTLLLVTCGMIGSERWRCQSEQLTQGPIAERCRHLAQALGAGCHVGLGVFARLSAPILIGIFKPMILLPPAVLTGWSGEQLDMVLLHELAHVRRWDNFVNLLQRLVEALLFFHPVVWWLSAWIRLERELCCDQFVIAHTGNPRAYAETLAALAVPDPVRHASAMAMTENRLVVRIRRILNLEDHSMQVSTKSLSVAVGLVLVVAVMAGLYAQEPKPGGTVQGPSRPGANPMTAQAPNRDPLRAASPELPPGTLPPVVLPVDPTEAPKDVGNKAGQKLVQPAQVEAFEQVQLVSRVAGVVKSVKVDLGDRVKRGQVLVQLEAPDVELELRQKAALLQQAKAEANRAKSSVRVAQAALEAAKALVLEAESGVKSAKANREFRKKQVERLKGLLDARSIDQAIFDEARQSLEAAQAAEAASKAKWHAVKAMVEESIAKVVRAEADVQVAEAHVVVAEVDLQRTQALLQSAQIAAPFDGVVTRLTVEVGMFSPAAGQGNTKPLLTVARTDLVRIVVQVPAVNLPLIRTGTPATVRIDALPDKKFEAKVSRLAPTLDPNARTMRVEIALPNPEGWLLPGMTGVVTFRSGK